MVKVLTHLIAPQSSKPLLYHKWLRFLACSLCSLALAIPKHNIPQTNETTETLRLIRGSKGGHLHLFTSPKDAEDDFEVWNPEEFPPEAGIKSQAESPRILTSNEATHCYLVLISRPASGIHDQLLAVSRATQILHMAKWLFLVALSCFMERSWEYRSRLRSDVENGNHQLFIIHFWRT